jgi:carboxylesterase type B
MKSQKKVPVILYIHGGAFMLGGSNLYGPDNIMKFQNMIVVTINYRLGVLGFLSTQDEAIPGNFGMKDQVEAMKWVQRNIKAFYGDPKKVTIVGFSCGAASVHLHYMSPMTDGLFNNGISHSGVAINPNVIQEKAVEKAHALAVFMNCPQDHTKLLKCLRKKSAEELTMYVKNLQPFLYNPYTPFGIVIEEESDSAYITDHPLNLLKKGEFKKLPWILSQTEDEGLYPAAEFYINDHLDTISNRWYEFSPFLNDFNSTSDNEKEKLKWSKAIREFYMQDQDISKETFKEFRQVKFQFEFFL